jgi:hypothetical protein
MGYNIGTTITVDVTFKDTAGALSDVTTLKYRPYLYKNDPLSDDVILVPADAKISTGLYRFNYTIPATINTEISHQLTLLVTATVAGITKVHGETIDIDWTT